MKNRKYKCLIYCPDDNELIGRIIEKSSNCGAGITGNYSQVAFIIHGEGNWKSEPGSKPYEGQIGKVTRSKVARIEITCEEEQINKISKAVKKIHPWEKVDIEFIQISDIL